MAIKSTLIFEEKTHVIKQFSWGVKKTSDETGMPSGRAYLKRFNITIEAVSDTFFEEWAMSSNMTKNMIIKLEHNVLGRGKSRSIYCYDCYLLKFETNFSSDSKEPMTFDLTISCGGLEHSNSTAIHSEWWRKTYPNNNAEETTVEDEDLIFKSVHFEDENGEKINEKYNGKAILVLKTENGNGKIIDVDLANAKHDFKYKGEIIENDILKNISITSDIIKLDLEIIEEQNA